MRKVFLDELPRRGKTNQFNWKKSIGYIIAFVYDDIQGVIKIVDYIVDEKELIINYLDTLYNIKIYPFINCNFSRILGIKTKDFKIEIGTRFKDDKRDITITDREIKIKIDKNGDKKNEKWYKFICKKCGLEAWKIEHSLLKQNCGCPACCNSPQVVILGINTIWDTDKWMIPIVGEEIAKTHTHGSNNKIYPICPKCHNKQHKAIPIHNIYKNKIISCEYCSDGIKYPNKFAYEMLSQLNINFETEYSPEWIKPKRYDFYFKTNNKEYILEMDGHFHKNDNKMNGQTKEKSEEIDYKKDNLALEHNIEIIRIDCNYYSLSDRFEYIKNNILKNNKLNELFNLSNVDWNKIDIKSQKSIMLEVCDLKKNKPNLTTGEIKNIVGIKSNYIIQRYLEMGNDLELCRYSIEQEKLYTSNNNANRLRELRSVPIINLNDEMVWLSASDCERESVSYYGFKLNHNLISQVCKGNRKSHHDMKFKYIKDLTPKEYIKYDIENKLKDIHNQESVQAC